MASLALRREYVPNLMTTVKGLAFFMLSESVVLTVVTKEKHKEKK